MKRWIVVALERACDLLRHHPYPCRLARLSASLDESWGTGVWRRADFSGDVVAVDGRETCVSTEPPTGADVEWLREVADGG